MPHDYVDMNLPGAATAWTAYKGRIGSLARQRKPESETDQVRHFLSRTFVKKLGKFFGEKSPKWWCNTAENVFVAAQDRMFHTAVAQNEFVTGPDHRKWATLPPDFSSDPAFTTDHRQQYGTAGHYAHAYLNKVHRIPPCVFPFVSFVKKLPRLSST